MAQLGIIAVVSIFVFCHGVKGRCPSGWIDLNGKCYDEVNECVAVGLFNSTIIPPSSFTASSYYPNYPPHNARLNNNSNGWTPRTDIDKSPYLEVDLGDVFYICAIETQGDRISIHEEWTTKYKLQFSVNGSVWQYYRTKNGTVKLFTGNSNSGTVARRVLPVPVMARKVRFWPTSYRTYPTTRLEIYKLPVKIFLNNATTKSQTTDKAMVLDPTVSTQPASSPFRTLPTSKTTLPQTYGAHPVFTAPLVIKTVVTSSTEKSKLPTSTLYLTVTQTMLLSESVSTISTTDRTEAVGVSSADTVIRIISKLSETATQPMVRSVTASFGNVSDKFASRPPLRWLTSNKKFSEILKTLTITIRTFPKTVSNTHAKHENVKQSLAATQIISKVPSTSTPFARTAKEETIATQICDFGRKPATQDNVVPLFRNCTSNIFEHLKKQMEAASELNATAFQVNKVLASLFEATKIRDPKSQLSISVLDLQTSMDILHMILLFQSKNMKEMFVEENHKHFIGVVNNLFDPVNLNAWNELEMLNSTDEKDLITMVDEYGHKVGCQLTTNNLTAVEVNTTNIGMQVKRIWPNSQAVRNGLIYIYNETIISLPAEVFWSHRPMVVVNVVYLTLNNILQLSVGKMSLVKKLNTTSEMKIKSSTSIVSSTIRPPLIKPLNKPVKIVLQNKEVLLTNPVGTCVFWKPGLHSYWEDIGCERDSEESNDTITTCVCNHLTVFAALMDPYGVAIPDDHKKGLEIVSTVGCSISLLTVTLTVAITMFFWKILKGPRTIVLVNLCIAIACACLLVIIESFARGNKIFCTVMAALLHFFLLAVFCWTLCEGILLYIFIVRVIGESPQERLHQLLIFGWCFPAMIVLISLCITRTEGYGYKEACWLSVDNGLIWAFVAPAVIIITVNTVILVLVIRNLMGTRNIKNKSKATKLRTGVKAMAVVLPLLGITWILGMLSFGPAAVVIKYLFAIFNSLQGMMIFVFHCLLDKQVQGALKRKLQKAANGGNLISKASTQTPVSSTFLKNRRFCLSFKLIGSSKAAKDEYQLLAIQPRERKITTSEK